MRFSILVSFLTVLCWQTSLAYECGTCTNNSTEPIIPVPPPWTLDATVYALPIIAPTVLPAKAYSPLERKSTATAGNFVGILGVIMLVRYSATPVGPYDELVIIPGYFDYPFVNTDGTTETHTNIRGSRFYVSQKYTSWNGRVNWNIPKHLAEFVWTDNDDGSTSVKIYPYDTWGSPDDAGPATLPFFQAKFTPSITLPLDINLDIFKYLGISPTLGQPPLPYGNSTYDELPGTTQWAETILGGTSNLTTPGIFDLDQGTGDNTGDGYNLVGDEFYPNFWPGLPRYNVGVRLDQGTILFPVPTTWPGES